METEGCRTLPTLEGQRSAQRERLFFIEFSALFLGQLRRKDVVNQFGISEPAATKDLSLYAQLSPDVMTYDFRRKCYLYTGGTLQFAHDVDQSLFALAGERAITQRAEQKARVPSAVERSIKRQVPLSVVSGITRCLNQRLTISAVYRSMRGGERERTLSPLALLHDGLRWHIRCYEEETELYKDYNLARFVSVTSGDASRASLDNDVRWNRWVELELVAHPKSEHPETIRLDYGFENSVKKIRLRSCLVGYFLRRWPIDYTDDATEEPRRYQLYLTNKRELVESGVTEWAFR